MKNKRRVSTHRANGTTHRRRLRGDETLLSASLGSPIFVESWHQGSPLNWVEFMGRWEAGRADRRREESED
ncbi:MAG: hypothetical protein KAJ97_08870 [Acidobacteria bacterium]|nr:hypothetical protein [Acidobacteriota bacterium]